MIGELTWHLWQSTLFAVVAGLLTLAFRGNRAQVRYWLWLSASVKFFIPFVVLTGFGGALQTWAPNTGRIATQIATPAVSHTMEQFNQPLFVYGLPLTSYAPATARWLSVALLGVWLCGFAAIALIRAGSWFRIRAIVRKSIVADIPAPVEVRISPGPLEPGVVGGVMWSRPVLLLPEGIRERLSPSELKAVLTHELCHVRRRDNLFASIHMVVEAVFWFHPLVWWIGARLVEERERACDEEVLNLGNRPDVYADAILNVCKLYVESPLSCVSGVTGSSIKRRVEAIMTSRRAQRLSRAKKFLLASAGMLVLTGPVVTGLMVGVGSAESPAVAHIFDVASIKLNLGTSKGSRTQPLPGGQLRVENQPLRTLISTAYKVQDFEVFGGPGWVSSDRYDIDAKVDANPPLLEIVGPMLRALLEDRFKLRVRREKRELRVYSLLTAKNGLKLRPTRQGSCVPYDPNYTAPPPGPGQKPSSICGSVG